MRMLKDCSFEKSLECCAENKFDFALIGMNGDSYGEIFGFYALYRTIAGRNHSVLMVKRPLEMNQQVTPLKYRLTSFGNRYYPLVSSHERLGRISALQEVCWGYILDHVGAYEKYLGDSRFVVDYAQALEGFDKEFLLDRQAYEEFTAYADCEQQGEYIAYDCRNIPEETEEKIRRYAEEQGLSVVSLAEDMMAENWLQYIRQAECVVSSQRDVINFAVIFEKKLLIPEAGLEEAIRLHILDIQMGERILGRTEDIQQKLSMVESLGYGRVHETISGKCAYAQKALDRQLKIVYRNIQRKDNRMSVRIKRSSIRILKRVLPPSVKSRVKKLIQK